MKKSRKVRVVLKMTLDMGEPIESVPTLTFLLNLASLPEVRAAFCKAGVKAINPGSTLSVNMART